jgi:hypothetical protein
MIDWEEIVRMQATQKAGDPTLEELRWQNQVHQARQVIATGMAYNLVGAIARRRSINCSTIARKRAGGACQLRRWMKARLERKASITPAIRRAVRVTTTTTLQKAARSDTDSPMLIPTETGQRKFRVQQSEGDLPVPNGAKHTIYSEAIFG